MEESKSLQRFSDFNKFTEIGKFQEFVNKQPSKASIQINKQARNSQFISIGNIEQTLDELYSGLWETHNFKYQIVVNEVIADIELRVFHPVAQVWITRTGAAAKPVMTKSGTDFTDVKNKILNCMVTVMPALKAECIKNAAKSLGDIFGRNLNRDIEDDYTSLSEQLETFEPLKLEAETLLKTAKIEDKLKSTFKEEIKNAGSKRIEAIVNYLKSVQQK